jgi:hypothetical protein
MVDPGLSSSSTSKFRANIPLMIWAWAGMATLIQSHIAMENHNLSSLLTKTKSTEGTQSEKIDEAAS